MYYHIHIYIYTHLPILPGPWQGGEGRERGAQNAAIQLNEEGIPKYVLMY